MGAERGDGIQVILEIEMIQVIQVIHEVLESQEE